MTKLNNIVFQLKEAANELLGRVSAIDKQVAELAARRDALTTSGVSKADFLEYMAAHFKRRGQRFAREIAGSIAGRREYARLERETQAGADFAGVPLFTGFPAPVVVTEEALCFYFGDVMAARLSEALDTLEWPENAVPVASRRAQLAAIESDTAELLRQRDELVAMLADAGITSV